MIFLKKLILSITSLTICAALLTGCGAVPEVTSAEPEVTTASATLTQTETSVGAIEGEAEILSERLSVKEEKPLVIAVDAIDAAYSPFTGSSRFDELADKLTGVPLVGRTRSGKPVFGGVTGEKERFGSKSYSYNGIADVLSSYDEESDTTAYSFALRSDVRFADGETLDADDAIFTLYVLLDPSYSGDKRLGSTGVVGAANYRYDSAVADTVTAERAAEVLSSDDIIPLLRERLTLPTLEKQYETVKTLYGDASYDIYTAAYPDPNDLFLFFFSIDSSYEKPEDAGRETVISDVADMYGRNYKQLASMTVGDETAFDAEAYAIAVEYITSLAYDEDTPREHITSISGIAKTGKFGLTVTVKGRGSEFEDALTDVIVAPLHYYGVEALFDYDRDKFGFVKGSVAGVLAAHAGQPLGAGPYAFGSYADGRFTLTANPDHYGGAPATGRIEIIEQPADISPVDLIADGTADIAFSDGSAASLEAAEEANRSIQKVLPAVSSGGGYGYIGLNAQTVNIAGDPVSEVSVCLRKGLATAISFYKEQSVRAYFGESCELTDYALTLTPRSDADDAEYIPPYTTDADGKPIFADNMTDSERRDAVKTACLGYFLRAGYVEDENGVITTAPEGGKLMFTALVTAGGTGDHPAYGALTEAAKLLGEIGITLNVADLSEPGLLWESISGRTNEIWAGAWGNDPSQFYPKEYYGIDLNSESYDLGSAETETELAAALSDAICRRAVDGLAIDIPLYKRTSLIMFSALRVDTSTVAEDMTAAYDWADEIETLKMK